MEDKEQPAASPPPIPSSTASPSYRKSRRSAQKRVVTVPVPATEVGKATSPPPLDSWAWRKYGQKPIKGSPYPRGYYRCSSSKGCPARKQVERSRVDPSMLIVTYSSDHNHPWPLPRSQHQQHRSPGTAAAVAEHPEEKFDHLMPEEPSLLMPVDFRWFVDRRAGDDLLFGPLMGTTTTALIAEDFSDKFTCGGGAAVDDEEEALFAGLGELPEFSVICRRGFLDPKLLGLEEAERRGMEAHESAAASWCRSTG